VNTKSKGDIAVANAIRHYITSGYEVSLPIGDKREYDFIVEKDGLLSKVQVKYAGLYKDSNSCKVGLRITGGNQSFNYSKKYSNDSFDILFVYTQKGDSYSIPWKYITSRNEINIEHSKYSGYKV
jgi:hypothetical protein